MGHQAQHFDLARGEPGSTTGPPRHLSGAGGDHRGDRVAVEAARARLGPQPAGGISRRDGRPVRPLLHEVSVGVGRGQHAGHHRELGCSQAAVEPGAVTSLMVRAREFGQWGKRRHPAEHLRRVVGVQPGLIALSSGPRPRRGPDPGRRANPADVVKKAGDTDVGCPANPELVSGIAREVPDRSGVAVQPRALEVNEVAAHAGHLEQAIVIDSFNRVGFGVEGEQIRIFAVQVVDQLPRGR